MDSRLPRRSLRRRIRVSSRGCPFSLPEPSGSYRIEHLHPPHRSRCSTQTSAQYKSRVLVSPMKRKNDYQTETRILSLGRATQTKSFHSLGGATQLRGLHSLGRSTQTMEAPRLGGSTKAMEAQVWVARPKLRASIVWVEQPNLGA